MNILVLLVSIVIHFLVLLAFFSYANITSDNGELTQTAGVNTVVGTRITIKRVAPSQAKVTPSTIQEKTKAQVQSIEKKVSPPNVTEAKISNGQQKMGFSKQKRPSNTVKTITKIAVNKHIMTEVIKKGTPLVSAKADNKHNIAKLKTKESVDKLSTNSPPVVVQKGVKHTGDNVSETKISTNKNNVSNTLWNQYKTAVFSAINAQKIYPKQARLRRAEGTVVVKFDITKLGNISRFSLIQQANSEHLNRSTRRLFEQLYLPELPASVVGYLPVTLTVPIEYSLN